MRSVITFEECMEEVEPNFDPEKKSSKAAFLMFQDFTAVMPDWVIGNKTVLVQYLGQMIDFPGNAGKIIVEAASVAWKISERRRNS